MRKLVAAVAACFFGVQCSAAEPDNRTTNVVDPHYSITLHGDWKPEPSSDPEQRSFYSKKRDVGLVLSAMGMKAARSDTERVARKFAEVRLDGERNAAAKFDLKMTIAEPVIVARPWGHAIAYYGNDNTGRHLSFAGAVIPSAVISVYVESKSASEAEIKATLDEVLRDLKFDKSS